MNRTLMVIATPLFAAPIVAAFLLVGGTAERPGQPVVETPAPTAGDAGCRLATACPHSLAGPLEC